ncbi:hypothetical protein BD310DRAFT_976199 [Dichomitus squalens]|uniref:Alpha-L-rhamnosidase C-terminal domain-containing protein n=1 Tax=Dichomitus squalens TaxID=114155 RepID=A0A4Q9PZ47_9APHY|nr:hypothetical protein BD310DRAFT_976199 [Dichomitus squalens]
MAFVQTYVGGIQLVSAAGATWAIVPQVGDLTHVDAGFSTTLGRVSSKWFANGTVFGIDISTPQGTTGTVGVPLPGNYTTATVSSADGGGGFVRADESGRYWITDLAGGDHHHSAAFSPAERHLGFNKPSVNT